MMIGLARNKKTFSASQPVRTHYLVRNYARIKSDQYDIVQAEPLSNHSENLWLWIRGKLCTIPYGGCSARTFNQDLSLRTDFDEFSLCPDFALLKLMSSVCVHILPYWSWWVQFVSIFCLTEVDEFSLCPDFALLKLMSSVCVQILPYWSWWVQFVSRFCLTEVDEFSLCRCSSCIFSVKLLTRPFSFVNLLKQVQQRAYTF